MAKVLQVLQIQRTIVDASGHPRRLFDIDASRMGEGSAGGEKGEDGAEVARGVSRSEAVTIMRRAHRRGGRFGLPEIIGVALAIGAIVLGVNIGGVVGEIVGIGGVILVVLGVIPFQLRRDLPRKVVPALLRAGYCPSCCRELAPADDAGLRACSSCEAVWKSG